MNISYSTQFSCKACSLGSNKKTLNPACVCAHAQTELHSPHCRVRGDREILWLKICHVDQAIKKSSCGLQCYQDISGFKALYLESSRPRISPHYIETKRWNTMGSAEVTCTPCGLPKLLPLWQYWGFIMHCRSAPWEQEEMLSGLSGGNIQRHLAFIVNNTTSRRGSSTSSAGVGFPFHV